MLKWFVAVVVVSMVVLGCGQGVPQLAYPQDGQKIALDQTPCFDVTLADNDYQDVSIEVRGWEVFEGDLTCRNGINSPASCCYTPQVFGGGFSQTCVEGRPCVVTIIARRGDFAAVRTVNVIRQSTQAVQ